MAEKLLEGMEHEAVAASEIETDMQKQAQAKLAGSGGTAGTVVQTGKELQVPEGGAPAPASTPMKVGFFSTLGMGFLSGANKAIGGADIEFEGGAGGVQLQNVKSMEELCFQQLIESGAELDKKYLANVTSAPEARYAVAIAFFFMLKGRSGNVVKWIKDHRKKPEDKPK